MFLDVPSSATRNASPDRRELLRRGAACCLALLSGCGRRGEDLDGVLGQAQAGSLSEKVPVAQLPGAAKPAYAAPQGTHDPLAHSVADNLFWLDALAEHAGFFVRLMPGTELAEPRTEAMRFGAAFTALFEKARTGVVDRGNYQDFNRRVIRLTEEFIRYKLRMHDDQASGRMHSLAWPAFFDHTAREADRYLRRLAQLNSGETGYDRAEVVEFWSGIMQEHASFVAHLLAPEERLIERAHRTRVAFREIHALPPSPGDHLLAAVDDVIDFQAAAERGITAGRIHSIMHPQLADHMLREALRFRDELRRAE